MVEQAAGLDVIAIGRSVAAYAPTIVLVTLLAIAVLMLARRPKAARPEEGSSFLSRVGSVLVAAFTTNWQLTLLATTAFVLSVASGWTTWDGMRNFTGEPVLSFLVTFGIQGVMLIIAWLIGESFASGMGRGGGRYQIERYIAVPAGILCFIGLAHALGLLDVFAPGTTVSSALSGFANSALWLGLGLLAFAALFLNQRSAILDPYIQSAQVIARNVVLWIMFLSCMATSVFFSFDSLFSSIFPADERRRSADIRAQRQVAGTVADIGVRAARSQAEEARALFASPGWIAYEENLRKLSAASQNADSDIEKFFVDRMEAHKSAVAAQQQRIADARSNEATIGSRKNVLADELARLKAERPTLSNELAEKRTELETRNRAIDAKRVEAMAEERGAEGTLKAGKGPIYRQRMAEMAQMRDAVRIQEERVRDAQKRMTDTDTRIAQLEREIAGLDASLAKLRGEASTAEQRIQVAEANRSGDTSMPRVDPARVRSAFERAVGEFRQQPTVEHLNALSSQCTQLLAAMEATPATKDRVRDIDCDPKQASDAASRVFALNTGLVSFARMCAGGDKLPQSGGIDVLLQFGRKCLQESGLPSKESAEMAAVLSAIDLNRDDKAHRFVVTWNAFADGNRLAYLALAIAIAIDSLVFMSGLFGANAVRSPLTEIEDRGEMTADQLEATIDATLKETAHPKATLSALLGSMHPVASVDGFTSEIVLDPHDPLADEMRQVLVAGANIGAVRPVGRDRTTFLVHAGLTRYLALAKGKTWRIRTGDIERRELVNVVGVALLPDPPANAEIVLSELHPISDAAGFAAETNPFRIADETRRRLVMNTLGAGATIPGAVRRNNEDGRYFVSTDFYKTLLMMRAGAIPRFNASRQRTGLPAPEVAPSLLVLPEAGRLAAPSRDAIEPPAGVRQPAGPSVPVVPAPAAPHAMPPPVPPVASAPEARPDPRHSEPMANSAYGEAHDPSLGDEIRAEIIHVAGLHAWREREIEIARSVGAGSEPEQALRRLAMRAPRLAKLVGETIDENRQSLREAYDYLLANRGGEPMYRQVLETVATELDELMPVLMLTPGGPYQQILENVLIYPLERQAGDGTLSPADEQLLARARSQAEALRGLSDRAADRYARLVQIIDHYDERLASEFAARDAADMVHKRSAG